MQENTKFARITKPLLISPYFLLIFLIIPVYTILSLKLHFPVSGDLLLFNNGCFLVCIALRFIRYALRMRSDIRYGADYDMPDHTLELGRPASLLQAELADAGYRFDADGRYGEKRDLGYLGTTVLYAGLLVLLLFGSYDYMREYSIMLRSGVGEPIPLDGKGLVGEYEAGALVASSSLPKLQIRKQILPNAQWPKGATEIALLSNDGKELTTGTIAPGKSFRYGGLDFFMTKFLFDALIMIRDEKYIIYESFVKFLPLPEKEGVYTYYGGLVNKDSGGVRAAAVAAVGSNL